MCLLDAPETEIRIIVVLEKMARWSPNNPKSGEQSWIEREIFDALRTMESVA